MNLVPVFADTNLGTRLAMGVLPDMAAGSFKREFERAHVDCFPTSGQIQVLAVKVKRDSFFYYLPDSLPLMEAFHGMERPCLVHVDLRPSDDCGMPSSPQASDNGVESNKNGDDGYSFSLPLEVSTTTIREERNLRLRCSKSYLLNSSATDLIASKGKKKKIRTCDMKKTMVVTPCKSQIIPKSRVEGAEVFFSNAKQGSSTTPVCASPQCPARTFANTCALTAPVKNYLGDKRQKTEVGRSLVRAAHNLGFSANKCSPAVSLFRRKNGKKLEIKCLAYDLNDNSD